MGSSALKVSLVEFQQVYHKAHEGTIKKLMIEKINVIADSWDESINGNLFTIKLAEDIAD